MSEAAAMSKTCTHCGRDFGRFFVYCPHCPGPDKLVLKAEAVAPTSVRPAAPASPPPRVAAPRPAAPQPRPAPVAQPSAAPAKVAPVVPAAGHARVGGIERHLKSLGPLVALGIAIFLLMPKTAKNLEAQVGADRWQTFDLRSHFGRGVSFVVTADAPLRLRTAGGKPVTTVAGAVSLGDLADGKVEARTVQGTAKIAFVPR